MIEIFVLGVCFDVSVNVYRLFILCLLVFIVFSFMLMRCFFCSCRFAAAALYYFILFPSFFSARMALGVRTSCFEKSTYKRRQ